MLNARTALIVIGSIACGLAAGVVLVLNPTKRDPFLFLSGKRVHRTGTLGPGSWGPKDIRIYTWEQDWKSVAAQAKLEMPKWGMTEIKSVGGVSWGHNLVKCGPCGTGSDLFVDVFPGRANTLGSSQPLTDKNPKWVTVMVAADAEDNWLTILRYTVFPIPE